MIRLTSKTIPLLVFLAIHIFNDVSAQSPLVPKLESSDSKKEMTIHEGENLILHCSGDKPIIFYYPNENSKENVGQASHMEDIGNGHRYQAKFFRKSVTSQDTGYYGCVYRDLDLRGSINGSIIKSLKEARKYVYAKSNERLFVEPKTNKIIGYVNHPIMIPCRPTSSDYNVTLSYLDPDTVEYKEIPDVPFDPKKGFLLSNFSNEVNTYYRCEFLHKDKRLVKKWRFTLKVEKTPKLELETTPESAVKGQDVQLDCQIPPSSQNFGFKLQWKMPNGSIYTDSSVEDGRTLGISQNEESHDKRISLKIPNIGVKDKGRYICEVLAHRAVIARRSTLVHVYDPPKLEIGMKPEFAIKGQDIQLECTIQQLLISNDFKLQWIMPNGIPFSGSSGRISSRTLKNGDSVEETILLTIKNVNAEDQGAYTCRVVSTELRTEPKTINVFVYDPPKLEIRTTPEFAIKGQDIQLECMIQRLLISYDFNLQWIMPNGSIYTDPSEEGGKTLSAFQNEKSPYKTISLKMTNVEAKDQGRYTCVFLSDEVVPVAPQYIHVNVYDPPKLEMRTTSTYALTGQDFHFECRLYALASPALEPQWITPNGGIIGQNSSKNARIALNTIVTQTKWPDVDKTSFLTIKNMTLSDRGDYTCVFLSKAKSNITLAKHQYIQVYDPQDIEISLSLRPEYPRIISHSTGTDATFSAMIHVSPLMMKNLIVEWRSRDYDILSPSDKYEISPPGNDTTITIKKVNRWDYGPVYLLVSNGIKNATTKFFLEVYRHPVVRFGQKFESRYYPNTNFKFECRSDKLPVTNITWYYLENDTDGNPHLLENATLVRNFEDNTVEDAISTLFLSLNKSTIITCKSCNKLLCSSINQTIIIADDKIELAKSQNGMLEESDVNITCKGSALYYTNVTWFDKDRKDIKENNRIKFTLQNSSDFLESTMSIDSIKKSEESSYMCGATAKNRSIVFTEVKLSVKAKEMPAFIESNMNGSEVVYDLKTAEQTIINLTCCVRGSPKPNISWFKDDLHINEGDDTYKFSNDNQLLRIIHPDKKCNGVYRCVAQNKLNIAQVSVRIVITEGPMEWPSIVGIVLGVATCIITAIVGARIYWIKKIKPENKPMTLEELAAGNYEHLNFGTIPGVKNLSNWAFPREKLKLQKRLGCGQFGMVVRAEAYGIVHPNKETTVAVKMVRNLKDSMAELALVSELRALSHLGKHLNIVNLLGAVTDNIKGLLVIVEYCEHGNLEQFLIKSRENFYCQTNVRSAAALRAILDKLERVPPHRRNGIRHKYAHAFFSRMQERFQNGWRINFNKLPDCPPDLQRDYSDILLTEDLLIWAYQVALGMHYVSQKQILHGDLAARNILLSSNNIVKICDFGLAKILYNDERYRRQRNTPMPIKWMAIESIREKEFSTQSDVWSFGVLMWEMFTLAATPYSGVEPEDMYQRLNDGLRLEKTDYMTDEIYRTMRQCWRKQPSDRPTFSQLGDVLGKMLPKHVTKHYIELNNLYNQSEKLKGVQTENCSAAPIASDRAMTSRATGAAMEPQSNGTVFSSKEPHVVLVHSSDQAMSTVSAETKVVENPGPSSTGTPNCVGENPGPSLAGTSNCLVENPGPSSASTPYFSAENPGPSSASTPYFSAENPGPSSTGTPNYPDQQPTDPNRVSQRREVIASVENPKYESANGPIK